MGRKNTVPLLFRTFLLPSLMSPTTGLMSSRYVSQRSYSQNAYATCVASPNLPVEGAGVKSSHEYDPCRPSSTANIEYASRKSGGWSM